MLRITKLLLALTGLLALWATLLSRPGLVEPQRSLVLWSPLLLILLFGAYSAVALLYGVATFRTVPEEAEALAKEVAIAKEDLARKGIKLS